jgi:hypothetical protein
LLPGGCPGFSRLVQRPGCAACASLPRPGPQLELVCLRRVAAGAGIAERRVWPVGALARGVIGQARRPADLWRRRDPGWPDDQGWFRLAASPDRAMGPPPLRVTGARGRRRGPSDAGRPRLACAGCPDAVPAPNDAGGAAALPGWRRPAAPACGQHGPQGARRGRTACPQARRGARAGLAQGPPRRRRIDTRGPGCREHRQRRRRRRAWVARPARARSPKARSEMARCV